MLLDEIDDVDRLRRIGHALMNRVESQLDQHGNSFSLFQTALNLEGQVKRRTDELTNAMHRLENTNDELAQAKETAEIANQSKTSFLAAASHDVLQPLNAALLSVSVLADMQTTEKGRALADQVERSLENMSSLLGTLLDISRLETGVMQPVREVVGLEGIFEGLEVDFRAEADRKQLALSFTGGHLSVLSDRTMLRRILQNLVSNALRYTEKGSVEVKARKLGEEVVMTVNDTGYGISKAQQKNVFEEFNRGDAASRPLDKTDVGFGLGLSIVNRMIQALDHKLVMRSKVAEGTSFKFKLPLAKPVQKFNFSNEPRSNQGVLANLQGIKVLLLENEPAVLEAMLALLNSWHCDVVAVATTQDAIGSLGDTDWMPQIIIADQHLDQGDLGTAALDEIWAYTGRRIPSIVASADPTDSLSDLTAELGVELMVKPVRPAALRALVTHLVSN